MYRKWHEREYDSKIITALTKELGISDILAQVLVNRGIHTTDEARHFLYDTPDDMADPFLLKGMKRSVDRIFQAIDQQDRIVIYGDYDVDGITSTSLLYIVLSGLGANISYYIPERQSEGYGLNGEALEKLAGAGTNLLITVDCGISSYDDVAAFKDRFDIIITDHHEPPDPLPEAYAVINPKQDGCPYPFKELAGAGVAYKLCQALWQHQGLAMKTEHMELAALGTIADLVALNGENRIIAKAGLERMKQGCNVGLQALLHDAAVEGDHISAGRIAFTVAPRLNAAGRISHAVQGVRLLLEQDPLKARDMAAELSEMNGTRQEIERHITDQAITQIVETGHETDGVLIAAGADWHSGVIGIAASRLVERFYRPSLVISLHEGVGKGSCRSIPGFNMYEALQYAKDELIQFGGHPMAAGFSVEAGNIERLRDRLNDYARCHMAADDYIPQIWLDRELTADRVTLPLIDELAQLEPYGMGNSRPVFALKDYALDEFRPIGKDKQHVRLSIERENGNRLSGVGWSMAEECLDVLEGDQADLAVTLERNEFNGMVSPQMVLQDIHVHEQDIHLDRAVMVEIYTALRRCLAAGEAPVWLIRRRVLSDLSGQLEGHQICAGIMVLQELGILEIRRDGEEPMYFLTALKKKMSLDTSLTYLRYGGQ